MRWPTTSVRPPNTRCQNSNDTMTYRELPYCSWSSANTRPITGETPSTRKKPCVTLALFTDCGSPSPVTVRGYAFMADISSKERVCACQSEKSGGDVANGPHDAFV